MNCGLCTKLDGRVDKTYNFRNQSHTYRIQIIEEFLLVGEQTHRYKIKSAFELLRKKDGELGGYEEMGMEWYIIIIVKTCNCNFSHL